MYAVDTSVLILRQRDAGVAAWFQPRLLNDEIAICDMVALEYLVGARNGGEYDRLAESLDALHRYAIEPADWSRARAVQRGLAGQTGGGQRAVKLPDLIIAAATERAGLTLVHYDSDYDRIAAVSGQDTIWVVPRGSIGT